VLQPEAPRASSLLFVWKAEAKHVRQQSLREEAHTTQCAFGFTQPELEPYFSQASNPEAYERDVEQLGKYLSHLVSSRVANLCRSIFAGLPV
jgi:hypothetical protein